MARISVIVPVYRVEPYLDRCVQSIVEQTYRDLEIILVDDGSPDNCGSMCDAWAAKDPRIKVIHQENRGGGAARNAALDVSNGEYIAFVDSDDYIASDMFDYLYSLLEDGGDIAECAYVNVVDDNYQFVSTEDLVYTCAVQEAMQEHIQDRFFRQLIWNKLYRRELIADIRFPVGKKIDDEFFTYLVLGNARSLIRSEKVCYAYRQQDASVMHSMGVHKRLQAVEAKLLRHQYIVERFPAIESLSLKNLWFTCIYLGQLSLIGEDIQQQKCIIDFLRDILKKHPYKASNDAVMEKIWLSMARISFGFTCELRNWLRIGL